MFSKFIKTIKNNKMNLKSLFFNDGPSDEVKASKPDQKVEVQPQQVQPQVYTVGNTGAGIVNPDIYNAFNDILDEFNIPGPDYLEVKKAADALKTAIPDENSRLIAAVATVKATSPTLSKQIILDSISKYTQRIEAERKDSEVEFNNLFQQEVITRQSEIDSRKKAIDDATKAITDLQQKIAEHTGMINTLSGELQAKQMELDIKKKNFDATIDAFIGNLNSDKVKFETLINI